jgi:uncharacterized membrane protein YhhN
VWAWGIPVASALGAGHIAARSAGAERAAGILKAVPIALLAAVVAAAPAVVGERYRWLVFAALLWSLGGDVWLLFPGGFLPGLVHFLIAHVLYIAAFVPGGGWGGSSWLVLVPFAGCGLAMLAYLWPHLRRDGPAVAVYVGVIVAMAWRAATRALAPGTPEPSGELALAGAVLFMVSDGLLATDRFARPFPGSQAAVMATYYVAQTLIALSVRP